MPAHNLPAWLGRSQVLKASHEASGHVGQRGLELRLQRMPPLFHAASWRGQLPGYREALPPSTHSFPVSPQEAVQCVEELNVPGILPVFVQVGVESTLERSQITRDHMGQLLYQLVQSEKLSKQDFFKGWV